MDRTLRQRRGELEERWLSGVHGRSPQAAARTAVASSWARSSRSVPADLPVAPVADPDDVAARWRDSRLGRASRIILDDLDDLAHSYALTVHKAQGSEFAHVVAPLTMDAPRLLTRRLFYTLATRARTTVVLVGQPRALRHALETQGPARATLLAQRLGQALAEL